MKTLITFIFLVFFASTALAEPMRCHGGLDTFYLYWPYRFSQVVNGLIKMVERDCGYCKFYDFKSPPKESVNQAFISLNETNLDDWDEQFVSIIISCPALTKTDSILEIEFYVHPYFGALSYHRAYELPSRSLFKDADAEKKIVDSLFKKIYTFYGWENRDAKYNDYLIDLSNLNEFSGSIFNDGPEIHNMNSYFENVSYLHLIDCITKVQNLENNSCIYYTNTNSPGYIADKDIRAAQDHLVKLATDGGQEILRFNFASPGWPKDPINLVFKPDPKRKILKLSKVLLGRKEIDPNDAGLRKFWVYLARSIPRSEIGG